LNLRNFQEAIAELSRGISGQPSRPERAYFARARAHEETGDLHGAYNDYRAAAQLAPNWEPAQLELARFRVRSD
jgi:Flp pilus assembly protein TadD